MTVFKCFPTLAAAGALACAACGADTSVGTLPLNPDGEAPELSLGPATIRAPFYSYYENIFISVTVGGRGPVLMLYDTGSPEIYVDAAAAAKIGIQGGTQNVSLGRTSLGLRAVVLTNTVWGGATLPGLPNQPVVGYAGNTLFAGDAVGLDFRDRQIWVTPGQPANVLPPTPQGVTGAPVQVPFQMVKGYLSVPCAFASGSADSVCLFDTGAMTSTCFQDDWAALPHPSPDTFQEQSIDSQGNALHSYYQRDEATLLGGRAFSGDAVAVTIDFNLLSSLGAELNLNLKGLIGALSFKRDFVTIDYANGRIILQPFTDTSWLPPSPFVGYGFSVASDTLAVQFVAPQSDAARAGVEAGDILVSMDGQSVNGAQLNLTLVQLIPGKLGETRTFAFSRSGQTRTATITAVNVLP